MVAPLTFRVSVGKTGTGVVASGDGRSAAHAEAGVDTCILTGKAAGGWLVGGELVMMRLTRARADGGTFAANSVLAGRSWSRMSTTALIARGRRELRVDADINIVGSSPAGQS